MQIFYADIKDCDSLGLIQSESWKEAYKGIVPNSVLKDMTPENCSKKFNFLFSNESGKVALIKDENQIRGFICFGPNRDEDLNSSYGEIWGVYLLPTFWGQGIGTQLSSWAMKELQKMGFHEVSLWVLEENINARKFYKKMGFINDGKIKEVFFDKKLNVCRYVKRI